MKRYVKADIVDPREESYDTKLELAKTTRSTAVMHDFWRGRNWNVKAALIDNPNLPDALREAILNNDFIVELIVKNSKSSPESLHLIYDSWDFKGVSGQKMLEWFAMNKNCPADILAELARHPSLTIREIVAMNESTPLAVLDEYSRSNDVHLRSSVVFNPITTPDMLRRLAEDSDPEVRSSVASNHDTPVDVLEELTQDPDHGTAFTARCTLQEIGEL